MAQDAVVGVFTKRVLADFEGAIAPLPNYGYQDSLALCAVDSVYSLAARYAGVKRSVAQYMAMRTASGADPSKDSLRDLIQVIDRAGGPVAAAETVFKNRQVAPGTKRRKAEALYGVSMRLSGPDVGVTTTADLVLAARDQARLEHVRRAWMAEPGLGYASWRYLLMLAGVPGVKIDRMITRYVTRTVGHNVPKAQVESAFAAAAKLLGVEIHELDHAIWRKESGRTS